jgi:hypothetical protein
MKTRVVFCLLFGLTGSLRAQTFVNQPATAEKVEIKVHPGIELFTIVQSLAGQYPMPNKSRYAKEAEQYFGAFANHPAVQYARNMGQLYTDVTELGYCLDNFPAVRVHYPDELSWYKLYGRDTVQTYMKLCRQFYDDTRFWDFYSQHRADYAAWAKPVQEYLTKQGLVAKLDSFYRFTGNAQWSIYLDPLNSWGAHAILPKNLNPRYRDRVVYNVGFFNRSSKDTEAPGFDLGSESIMMVWHEGSHIYTNELQRQQAAEIDKLAYLLNAGDEGMKRNNIHTWHHCFDENLVRGVVIALFRKHLNPKEARKQVAREVVGDFQYAGDIADIIETGYLNNPDRTNFRAFFPQILSYLAQKYPKPQGSTR